MPELLPNIGIYFASFIAVWVGSGLIVSSVTKLSHRLHISSFLISFVVLGILTSTPEIAVGLSAISNGTPGIFVGNLLGGIPVLFLLIIPLLAILGGGIRLSHNLSQHSIILTLIASLAPFFVVLDKKVTSMEGVVLIALYVIVVYFLERETGLLTGKHLKHLHMKKYSFVDILRVLVGTAIVFVSSNVIVGKTLYFSQVFNIAPFYISLVVLSLGTNLPEFTLAVRSLITGKKDIAFGDYLGSASVNAFLFGVFTLLSKEAVLQVDRFTNMFIFVGVGLGLFYYFSKTKNTISPREGLVLILVYVGFVVVELV